MSRITDDEAVLPAHVPQLNDRRIVDRQAQIDKALEHPVFVGFSVNGRIENLLDDGRLRRNFGIAGRKRVEEFFSWDKIFEERYLKEIFLG